jgi:putative hydrolase of the HAD superfamily
MIKAIVFDFGNVIGFFDHHRVSARLGEWGGQRPEQLHPRLFGGQLEDDYESGRLSSADFIAHLRREADLHCHDDEIVSAYSDIFWPNPEVCALLPRLKPRFRLFLASNTTQLHAAHFRRQFADVLRYFDGLVLSYEVGVRKPAPGFFERCEHLAESDPANLLLIDDLPANVEGARRRGWQGIVYTGFEELGTALVRLGVLDVKPDSRSAPVPFSPDQA